MAAWRQSWRVGMLPASLNVRAAGSCMTAARIIAGTAIEQGLEPVVVEGWIQFIEEEGVESDDFRFAHTWVEIDGEIVDPTLEQFDEYLRCYDFRRDIKEVIAARDYLADPRMNAHPEMFFNDGVLPDACKHFF